jgi:primosomal protein N' (replication factor Y)
MFDFLTMLLNFNNYIENSTMDVHYSQQNSSTENHCNSIVSVAFPIAIQGVYDYRVPKEMRDKIHPGTPVRVKVRSREIWGVAIALKSKSEYDTLKEVIEIKEGRWSDESNSILKLYEWVASYYQCDLGRVFRPVISKGILNKKAKQVVMYSVNKDKSTEKLKESYLDALEKMRAFNEFSREKAEQQLGIKASMVAYLFSKGFLLKHEKEVAREADEMDLAVERSAHKLTKEQIDAVELMCKKLDAPDKPWLLHGITGSGKTHVYIELTSRVLNAGKSVMILVPEISLTPQTIHRFRSTLGDIMTVIHSNMSDGERRDSLQALVTGAKKVVIGVRSAILAPMDNVGLIIVDEEHDGSYKQSDPEPRYNARDVAVMRGYYQKALVLLGSATPSMESFYNANSGKYHYIKLAQRFGAGVLPTVHIVNMTEEHTANNWTILSRFLSERIEFWLAAGRQVILLLNRRGFSAVLMCKDCGHTNMCPNCSVTLRYHRTDNTVKCHFCGVEMPAPDACPSCKGDKIQYKGTGIQKAEEFVKEKFPTARILRMDQDTTKRKGAHISILNEFAEGNADILIGTQMVSKGLNFPRVALVGVLQADTGLHLPDFRASERTFQLLTQVAGRAGRADNTGEVVIQTYFPDEMAIEASKEHDYEKFYTDEIEKRKEPDYPPYAKLARILFEGPDESAILSKINEAAYALKPFQKEGLKILGPSPAVVMMINNESRYSILIKSKSPRLQASALMSLRQRFAKLPKGIRLIIDVDPANML